MANIGLWSQKNMLDFVLKGASPSAPPGVWVALMLSAPASNVVTSEVAAGSGYTRQSATFGAAATPAGSGSASNANNATFGPFSSSCVISGLVVTDTSVISSGNNLWFGNLSVVRTPLAGDSLVLNAGALAITLA
jgi:hypothetical protein